MKIGIIGDLHFGAGYNLGRLDPETQLNSRLLDFVSTFDQIVDHFVEKNVNTIVLTGDIFETRHPTSAQLNAFSKCVNRAINMGTKIVIVVGNHDQQRTISTTTVDIFNSLETPGMSVYPNFGIHKIENDGEEASLILMPYRDRRMIGADTNSIAIDKISKKIQELYAQSRGTRIIIGHFMIGQPMTGENPDSFSINELVLPLGMFKNFDAVIMGHVHKHAVLSKKNPLIIYSGSMDKKDFGEKHHNKVSIILDTNNIENIEILPSQTRDLHEINLDYTSGDKYFKSQITDKILLDIEKFNLKYGLEDSIVKTVIKVKENDLYYVNQNKVKECVLSKKVRYLAPIQITSVNCRKLRNKDITENVDEKKAMKSFIKGLIEPDQIKKRLIKCANNIIEEVEGK